MSTERTFEQIKNEMSEKLLTNKAEFNDWYKGLSKNMREKVKTELNTRKAASPADESSLLNKISLNKEGVVEEPLTVGDPRNDKKKNKEDAEQSSEQNGITDSFLMEMWNEIDALDVSTFDSESTRVFDYQGFNPNEILRSMMLGMKANNVIKSDFMSDILTLCSLSVIKGSINEHNIKKISAEGQIEITRLEKLYSIKRGSGRSEPSNVVTVSRIGATFPGKIIQLLRDNKLVARKFVGSFKSHTMPQVIRHQAFASIIPTELNESVKEFLLSLVTAFSVDQSVSINPNKKVKNDLNELFDKQRSFVQLTADSQYPPENVRKTIFKSIVLDYESLLTTARALQKIVPEFQIISRDVFQSGISALS